MGSNKRGRVTISRECANYLLRCTTAIDKVASGRPAYNPTLGTGLSLDEKVSKPFDRIKHQIFCEELKYAIEEDEMR